MEVSEQPRASNAEHPNGCIGVQESRIAIRYEDIDTGQILTKGRRPRHVSEQQMELPFFIRPSGPHIVGMKLEPQRVSRRVWKLKITASQD